VATQKASGGMKRKPRTDVSSCNEATSLAETRAAVC